jgi:hypothetical protein
MAASQAELDQVKADVAWLKEKVLSLELKGKSQEGPPTAAADASQAAPSASPPPQPPLQPLPPTPPPPPQQPPSALSRAGLQGRYERLLNEERARHVDAAAAWLVGKVQAAAAIRLTRLDIDFFSKAAPAPSDCLACERWGVMTKKKYGLLNSIGLMSFSETDQGASSGSGGASSGFGSFGAASSGFGAPTSPNHAYTASMNEKVRKIDEELRTHGREVAFSTPDLKAQHEKLVMRQRSALLEQKKLFCFTLAVAMEGLIAQECVEDVVAAVSSALSDVAVALELPPAGSDSPIIRIDWS